VSGFESKYMRRRGAEAAKELLEELDPENRELMQALFIDEVGLEAYAKRIGKHASTVMRRRDRSLPMLYARINAMRRRG
jgi:DNA-directed RNA polymerase specialized sigma24 family protein